MSKVYVTNIGVQHKRTARGESGVRLADMRAYQDMSVQAERGEAILQVLAAERLKLAERFERRG